ncbi:MAG: 4-alpha-glucanotransferase [Bacteroidales bacterium]|nr:4-alpha-glucanotransferase [Bacteroidales bacterium]
MKLNVNIGYRTNWGEEIFLCAGGRRHKLAYSSDGIWKGEFARFKMENPFEYAYEVVRDGKIVRTEWKKHIIHLPEGIEPKELVVNDRWSDRPSDSPFYSSAFTSAIFGRKGEKARKAPEGANLMFQVAAPTLRPNEVLALAGSGKDLKEWSKIVPFNGTDFPIWTLALKVSEPFEYKILVADKDTLSPIRWEEGDNRYFANLPDKGQFIVEADLQVHFTAGNWKGAGTAIPVFSLRSADDFGVGEFYDLKKMVDWAAATGQSVLQLLPINDTTMLHTWEDSYPYNPNSTFALHPQYLNLPAAGVEADQEYNELKEELNALDQIDYERVNSAKLQLLRKAFGQKFKKLSATKGYKAFVEKNGHWLIPYAAFCVLRDMNGTPDFSKWKGFAKYSKKKVAAFCEENKSDVDFWCFVQYHLDLQLSQVCAYAHSKGVVFKGDLPIGISRTSVDAWLYPELFHMDSQAGAPPDAFSADGQNWGFPTYNWEKMAEDDYAWWKSRLAKMSEYFDAFRIDHILGFFRIWEIPLWTKSGLNGYFNPALHYPAQELQSYGFDVNEFDLFIQDPRKQECYHPKIGARNTPAYAALDGYRRSSFDNMYNDFFYHRNNEFWKEKAMLKLPALLDSTGMLACGEDLGMIPATVPQVMENLRILSLEIQRMPKSPEDVFVHPAKYPYLSVCTTSTHDMNPIRAWWEEDRGVTNQFWQIILGNQGEAPACCESWICRQILEQHLWSPAMLTILPLQDWLSMDSQLRREDPGSERINVPANSRHYWRYRMHLTIEELSAAEEFNRTLTDMIAASGRCQ